MGHTGHTVRYFVITFIMSIYYTYNKQIKSYYYFLKSEMIFNCKKRYCCFLRFFFGENPRRCGAL